MRRLASADKLTELGFKKKKKKAQGQNNVSLRNYLLWIKMWRTNMDFKLSGRFFNKFLDNWTNKWMITEWINDMVETHERQKKKKLFVASEGKAQHILQKIAFRLKNCSFKALSVSPFNCCCSHNNTCCLGKLLNRASVIEPRHKWWVICLKNTEPILLVMEVLWGRALNKMPKEASRGFCGREHSVSTEICEAWPSVLHANFPLPLSSAIWLNRWGRHFIALTLSESPHFSLMQNTRACTHTVLLLHIGALMERCFLELINKQGRLSECKCSFISMHADVCVCYSGSQREEISTAA